MYAIVEIAGQQFKVETGKKIFVHRLEAEEGKKLEFDQVLLIDEDGKITIGDPTGRLPLAIPASADHLPPFNPDAPVVEYGEFHGQALLDHLGLPAAYPYRFGLTYKS
jgi:hypothetical protein